MPKNTADIYTLDDMMGNPPGWLLRSGISLVFLATVGLLAMSWFIQYPDRLVGQAVIQTEFPPVEVKAPTSAVVETLLVEQHCSVEKYQPLALLENPAKWEDIRRVQSLLEDPRLLKKPESLQLGSVQAAFANWKSEWNRYQQALQNPETAQKITALENEKEHLLTLNQSIGRRIQLYEQELGLIQKDLQRSQSLREIGAISEVELEQKTNTELQSRRQREQLRSESVQNQVRSEQLSNQIIEARQARSLVLEEQKIRLDAARQQLESALEVWEQQYLIRATASGRIELDQSLVVGQYVNAGSRLLVISPEQENQRVVVRCVIPVQGVGKIAIGQSVQLELPAYPAEEFGALTGKVVELTEIPVTDQEKQLQYAVQVSLEQPFITNYGKEIPFQQNSTAQARIITKKRRLLHRILDQLIAKVRDV